MADKQGAVYLCVSPQAAHSEMTKPYIKEILTHAAKYFGQSRKEIIIKTIGDRASGNAVGYLEVEEHSGHHFLVEYFTRKKSAFLCINSADKKKMIGKETLTALLQETFNAMFFGKEDDADDIRSIENTGDIKDKEDIACLRLIRTGTEE